MKKNRTVYVPKEKIKREWFVIDAADQVLGRLATKVATYLRGKHKAVFSPQVDCGDFIVVINAEKVRVTGLKATQKTYFTHSGYPGGDKTISFEKLMEDRPTQAIRLAVVGMLPKNRLGRQVIGKLKIYAGSEYPQSKLKIKKLEV
jgi:large subunit ribosomal protein L13